MCKMFHVRFLNLITTYQTIDTSFVFHKKTENSLLKEVPAHMHYGCSQNSLVHQRLGQLVAWQGNDSLLVC